MAAKFQLVRYKAGKSTYEAICKPGTVLKFRQGKLGIDKVLESDDVWTNQQKGERPSDSDLEAAFGTSNPKECLLKIVSDGEVQLTAAERKEKVDKKRAEMINYLHKYYIDPRSNKPHPVVRLEEAFSQLKVRVDPDTPADRQVQDVVKKLPEILPVKKSEIELTLFVPHKHLGQVQGLMHDYAKVLSENWSGSGCSMQLTLTPGGMYAT